MREAQIGGDYTHLIKTMNSGSKLDKIQKTKELKQEIRRK